jgi:hypothetical protein
MDEVAPDLEAQGISTFDLDRREAVPVAEAARDWRKMAEFNENSPLPVLRP